MNILTATQVKDKLAQNPEIKLMMVMGPLAFQRAHIPGSVEITDAETAAKTFSKDTEIIVYCSDVECVASIKAYQQLERVGFKHIHRFAGGLVGWEEEGFELVKAAS